MIAIVALSATAPLYTLPGLAWARRRSPDRSPAGRDWHGTCRLRRVLGTALLAFVALLGASLTPSGVDQTATSAVSRLPAVAVLLAGMLLLSYTRR